eukprot:4187757-Amphidinium_carterae.1
MFHQRCLHDNPWHEESGMDIAEEHGAICGLGAVVAGEEVSYSGLKRALMPCGKARPSPTDVERGERYVFEPYSLHLLRKCKLSTRMRESIRWEGVAFLFGNLVHNIAHSMRDIVWIFKMIFLGLHEPLLQNINSTALSFVSSKYAASMCDVDMGHNCWTSMLTHETYPFNDEFLKHVHNLLPERAQWLHGGYSPDSPVCFNVAVQPWRDWVGDAPIYAELRRVVLEGCGLMSLASREKPARKIVIAERASRYRRWGRRKSLHNALVAFGKAAGLDVLFVNLGGNLHPCEAARLVGDAAIFLGVNGAEFANVLLLPQHAA